MIAVFTFRLADLKYQVGNVFSDWTVACESEFIETSPDSFPIRGDVTFLNKIQSELSIKEYKDGNLNNRFMVAGLDEQIKQWREEDYPCDDDAYTIHYWPQSQEHDPFLGITTALRSNKFRAADAFMQKHIGRTDLSGRLIVRFHGFSETQYNNPTIPTRDEFLKGRHYFATGDHTLTFSAALP